MARTIILSAPYARRDVGVPGLEADAALTPGHLLETTATGVKKHATQDGQAEALFACEDALQGKTIDDAYAANDPVSLVYPLPGDKILAWLKDGESTTLGVSKLGSNGDGTLKVVASTEYAIAVAEQTLAPVGADARIKVRIINGGTVE